VSVAPLIVNVALTGMVPTRERAPHVPLTTAQILADVERCRALGATVFHVHARDAEGRPTTEPDAYAPIVEGIRAIDPQLVVCVTCSGRHASEVAQRGAVLDLAAAARPDMASLTLGSNNFVDQASVNAPHTIRTLAAWMGDRQIRPELEAFEPGMVAFGKRLAAEGLIASPAHINLLLGGPGTAPLSPASLAAMLAEVPSDWTWGLAGIGRHQIDAALLAIGLGGHVRIGLEDNIWADRARTQPTSNPQLVERVTRIAAEADRPLADCAQTRRLLGLASRRAVRAVS
jgi:uncharacterized protein (DUF849 family)